MDELRPGGFVSTGDYREQWSCFDAERRRLLIRLSALAGGLAVSVLLLFSRLSDPHSPVVVRVAISGSFVLLVIAFLAQWFFFVWEMGTWPCPRCAERFFLSAFAFDPFFTRRCRHCGLLRLKNAEVRNVDPE
ncbi:hypothetical protein [Occallatibacter riparius]|uniref:Uncharacterized protein n=1 Tax=Occallatibacter riparius TaxID=1002689 RepID=A0A9J7BQE5_9BACT|nr:hypothetical protein [Occallatibacter riparius]UWZ85019.1 hypothetical protein MOP44_03525 [Occallatibacter riparius]